MLDIVNMSGLSMLSFGTALPDRSMADVIIVKALYNLVPAGSQASSSTLQLVHAEGAEQIFVADEPFGELNKSSIRHESDLAPYKPRCDVIVIGSAHSPTGNPVTRIIVRVEIDRNGSSILRNELLVHGPRDFIHRDAFDRAAGVVMRAVSFGSIEPPAWRIGDSEPFTEMPLRYEQAFGGELKIYANEEAVSRLKPADKLSDEVRERHPEGKNAPVAHQICRVNPVGCGFVEVWHADATREMRYPAPRIEAPSAPLTEELFHALMHRRIECGSQPALLPQGLGVITKAWQPRLRLAGTYDEVWRKEHWPYSPPDFDPAYWNGAHPSMQCPLLEGGETITVSNLLKHDSPGTVQQSGATISRFCLPSATPFLRLANDNGVLAYLRMAIDTLILDLDAMTLSLVWRVHIPNDAPVSKAVLVVFDTSQPDGSPAETTPQKVGLMREGA